MDKINSMIQAHNKKVAELKARMLSEGFRQEFVEGFVPREITYERQAWTSLEGNRVTGWKFPCGRVYNDDYFTLSEVEALHGGCDRCQDLCKA